MPRSRRRSWGSPRKLSSELPARVTAEKVRTIPATMPTGRHRPPPMAPPAAKTGTTGKTQGDNPVTIPANTPTAKQQTP